MECAGYYKGKEKKPTVVLEAICDWWLWIWHAHFSSPGSYNDINGLHTSVTMQYIREGELPSTLIHGVKGHVGTVLYYLADGMYPS